MFLNEQIARLQNDDHALPSIVLNTGFTSVLYDLPSVSLTELTQASLMNRIDTKYYFDVEQLTKLLNDIKGEYYALDMDGLRCIPYESLYFDTPGFDLYLQHHNRKQNRYKMRYRRYVNTDRSFFEIKLKTNKGRTIKTRIPVEGIYSDLVEQAKQLLDQAQPPAPKKLIPVIWIAYSRITLVSLNFSERVTIDIGLHFHTSETNVHWDSLCILEVKQDSANRHSPISEALKQLHLFPQSLSKYCVGVAATFHHVKYNQFKKQLLKIKKIERLHTHPHITELCTNS